MPEKVKVLFVCIENSCRSQMAEAFAKTLGKGKVDAYSAGSRPGGEVNPKAVEYMAEKGYDLGSHRPKALSEAPLTVYDYAITMGCGDECPLVTANAREDWKIPDPKEMGPDDFRKVRDMIEDKVRELIERMDKGPGA